MSVMDDAKKKSIELMRELSTERGFVASSSSFANYERVWSRDGMITSLAALLSGDEELIRTAKVTIKTLAGSQDHTGRIASNVSQDLGKVSYGTSVGRVDATLWFVVGVLQYGLRTGDHAFCEEHREAVEKALFYLECLELNGKDLIFIPQGGDWADEYIHEGYILYDQVLYFLTLSSAASVFENDRYREKAERLRERIRINYFPVRENIDHASVYNAHLFESAVENYEPPLPVSTFSSHTVEYRVDNFAIALYLLSGLADGDQYSTIVGKVKELFTDGGSTVMLPAFHPVVQENDLQWSRLRENFLFEFRNKPHQYHNGGLWPLVSGFFIAALDPAEREQYLTLFAETLARDDFTFPEFYNGESCEPGGIDRHAFTVSAYLIAHSITEGNTSVFL